MLNSELINKITRLKKLNKVKKKLKNNNSFKFLIKKEFLLFKLNIEVKNIIDDKSKQKKRVKLPI